ncbi:Asp23/Gls24 family envelope stress response protein [Nocardia otitidiscaviarum]|uniref:Asp23/Gls24 family envelope stress response protein n=1 Tax=Nocardia otitidiscaviarum TaxID=1823 RepID=UPI0004A752DD|nr:Asp23/Gls24 family envelope stress response protein [Nocardia otitidiscaviarum]MBF6137307.1 Asp23/Gls24 family envelope stress response protein [Nocardia otitidiscaviarum]MBF6237812.1 Asp23/Gls24 family envelope stress response protein [Nocardia otitidiscaviarum]MBF6488203.1 Asp23/Gls24 family envelope stress response protein [Nocardia otitidiscaviarum]
MTGTSTEKSTGKTAADGQETAVRNKAANDDALVTDQGTTTIGDIVVQKIAGLAAREVRGVHALGGGAARAFGAIRDRIPGASASVGQGVSVEVGEKQAAVDLELVVEYGVSIAELARAVRRNVITAIEQMTGLEVVEVNINVNDVYIPGDDDDESPASNRVQ